MDKPGRKAQEKRKLTPKHKREKELTQLATAQTVLREKDTTAPMIPTIKVPRHRKRTSEAKYQQLKEFDSELIRRCRESGMSDGEIREWMEEI